MFVKGKNDYRVDGNIVYVDVNNVEVIIDIDDLPRVQEHRWMSVKRGNKYNVIANFEIQGNKISVYLNRFIARALDHSRKLTYVNGNFLDLRKENIIELAEYKKLNREKNKPTINFEQRQQTLQENKKKNQTPPKPLYTSQYNKYHTIDDITYMWISPGTETMFDTEDKIKVKDYFWGATYNPEADIWYVKTTYLNKVNVPTTQYLHRYLMNATTFEQKVDHIEHNGLDNRKSKLRVLTNQENMQNRKSANSNNKIDMRNISVSKGPDGIERWRVRVWQGKTSKSKNFPYTDEGLAQASEYAVQLRKELGFLE